MKNVIKISDNIFRTTTPYKDIFTTIYAIKGSCGWILFDSASFDSDAEEYIRPFLEEVGADADSLKYVFISHNHKDHAGGLTGFLKLYPSVTVLTRSQSLKESLAGYNVVMPSDGDVIMDDFRVVAIPGHTIDSAGILDTRTNTLISGDSLQLYGIFGSQDWASNITLPVEHLGKIKMLREMEIDRLLTAHDYHPYGYRADGRAEVLKFLDASVEPLLKLRGFILENPDADDAKIREIYNASDKIPTISERVVAAMRAAIKAGEI